jgi:uncharacterized protein YjbI with pentapeptide repeats
LTNANLLGADFRHADLAGATLKAARYDVYTRWPLEYDPGAAGAVLEIST